MAAEGPSDDGHRTDDLLAQATEGFNRQATIARQMNGGLAWTAAEAVTVMRMVVNEVTYNEASQLGQNIQFVQNNSGPAGTRAAGRQSDQVEGRQRSADHRRGSRF